MAWSTVQAVQVVGDQAVPRAHVLCEVMLACYCRNCRTVTGERSAHERDSLSQMLCYRVTRMLPATRFPARALEAKPSWCFYQELGRLIALHASCATPPSSNVLQKAWDSWFCRFMAPFRQTTRWRACSSWLTLACAWAYFDHCLSQCAVLSDICCSGCNKPFSVFVKPRPQPRMYR